MERVERVILVESEQRDVWSGPRVRRARVSGLIWGPWLLVALAVSSPAQADLSDPAVRFLLGELVLRQSLESAYGDADSLIPVPDFDERARPRKEFAPQVDGSLAADEWSAASSFVWKNVGDSGLRSTVSWRLYAAYADESLWIAGVCESRKIATLSLLSGSRGEIFVTFDEAGASTAVFQCVTSTEAVDEHAGEFAATVIDGVSRFEMRIPESNGIWEVPVGADRPLRLTTTVRNDGLLTVSPAIRLVPGELAVSIEEIGLSKGREVTARVKITSHAARRMIIRYDYNDEEVIDPGGQRVRELTSVAPQNARGIGWTFNAEHIACRVGVATAFFDPARLREKTHELLARIRANLGWLSSNASEWRAQAASIEEALAEVPDDEVEELFLAARYLVRLTCLARLPADLEKIAFVRRHPFRTGPFYTTHTSDMTGGDAALGFFRERRVGPLLALDSGESIRDLAIDAPAKNLVFAVRNDRGETHLHALNLEKNTRRQITEGPHHDIEPCFLPNGDIVFTSNRHGSQSPINTTDNLCLHVVSSETGEVRRLSQNNLMDFTPAVLDDGRIVFLRWVHEDKPGNFINALWTVYPDGRGLSGFFGMNRVGMSIEPQPIPDSDLVVCIDSGANGHWRSPHVGDIGVVDFRQDPSDFAYRIERARGGFKHPYPVAPEAFLVAGGWVDTRWAIYVVDRYGNEELIYRDPQYSCFNPIPVRPRPTPNEIPNLTAKDRTKPAKILIQDVNEGLPGIEPGVAKELRVVHATERPRLPEKVSGFFDQTVPLGVNNRSLRRDLGTVPVHDDGSVYFLAPAETNIFFQVLDANGRLIQTMRDSVSFAPGEFRACVGCHEDRSLTPVKEPLGVVDALKHRPAQPDLGELAPVVSFEHTVQPILDAHCTSCHNSEKAAGNVNLSADRTPYFSVAYEMLVRGEEIYQTQYGGESAGPASTGTLVPGIQNVTQLLPPTGTGSAISPLMKLVDADHHGVKLDGSEKRALARWIDFNRPYYGDWTSGRMDKQRRILSARSEHVISSIQRRRCRGCHMPTDLFRGGHVNLTTPAASPILRAPLARDLQAWGTGLCGQPIFESERDADYRAILKALKADPRVDDKEAGFR